MVHDIASIARGHFLDPDALEAFARENIDVPHYGLVVELGGRLTSSTWFINDFVAGARAAGVPRKVPT
jgi:hypothetical protein